MPAKYTYNIPVNNAAFNVACAATFVVSSLSGFEGRDIYSA